MEDKIQSFDKAVRDVDKMFENMNAEEVDELDQKTIDRVNNILNTPISARLRRAGLLPQIHEYKQAEIIINSSICPKKERVENIKTNTQFNKMEPA